MLTSGHRRPFCDRDFTSGLECGHFIHPLDFVTRRASGLAILSKLVRRATADERSPSAPLIPQAWLCIHFPKLGYELCGRS
jgi:hypothetical protein